jgi:hypothetical protein
MFVAVILAPPPVGCLSRDLWQFVALVILLLILVGLLILYPEGFL